MIVVPQGPTSTEYRKIELIPRSAQGCSDLITVIIESRSLTFKRMPFACSYQSLLAGRCETADTASYFTYSVVYAGTMLSGWWSARDFCN